MFEQRRLWRIFIHHPHKREQRARAHIYNKKYNQTRLSFTWAAATTAFLAGAQRKPNELAARARVEFYYSADTGRLKANLTWGNAKVDRPSDPQSFDGREREREERDRRRGGPNCYVASARCL